MPVFSHFSAKTSTALGKIWFVFHTASLPRASTAISHKAKRISILLFCNGLPNASHQPAVRHVRLEHRSIILIKHKRLLITCAATIAGLIPAGFVPAYASSILLGSYGTDSPNPGVINSAVTYDPVDSTVNSGSNSTFDISAGTVWHSALANSSYVSFNAATGPTSSLVVPNGDYIYTTTFTLSAADASDVATLSLLADDTASVYLNNVLVQSSGGPMGPGNPYIGCSDVGPNCLTPTTFTFSGLKAGVNQLQFDVEQVNGANEGLDFSGSLTDPPSSVPEPLSLALFGTGLIGLVGLSRRYASDM